MSVVKEAAEIVCNRMVRTELKIESFVRETPKWWASRSSAVDVANCPKSCCVHGVFRVIFCLMLHTLCCCVVLSFILYDGVWTCIDSFVSGVCVCVCDTAARVSEWCLRVWMRAPNKMVWCVSVRRTRWLHHNSITVSPIAQFARVWWPKPTECSIGISSLSKHNFNFFRNFLLCKAFSLPYDFL